MLRAWYKKVNLNIEHTLYLCEVSSLKNIIGGMIMFNLKNLKIVKQLKSIKPRLKWLMFSQMQDYKVNSKYIDMICSDNDTQTANDKLEEMVKESLIREFTPEVQKMKSFDFLVDAVVHNLKKKQLSSYDAAFKE